MRIAAFVLLALALFATPAAAGPGDANADSIYLVGEFVDPVCLFQHGMQGATAKQCAMVSGRVEQGMGFVDVRRGTFYTVVGQNHWQDPRQGFLDALGETLAIKARVWRRDGAAAIVVNAVYPVDRQPAAVYRYWPWHFEWSVLLGCALLTVLLLLSLTVWRERLARLSGAAPRRGFERGRFAVFLLGMLCVVVSLDGPLHDLSDLYLFSTHMVQHLLLSLIFPPLFILGVPPWLWRALTAPPRVARVWNALSRVPVGFALYTIVFTLWHVPALYDLMMRQHGFHIAMHLMVMGTAILMWWPIAAYDAMEKPMGACAQILYLFVLSIPMLPVAAMITLADHPLYIWYALAPRVLPLSALEDQRFGGLVMWVPGTLFWWVIMSIVYFRKLAPESRADDALARTPS